MPATDILLIEDEPNIAEAVRFILTRDGWRLDHWSEGSQALARIAKVRPRLVILDVMLPAQSGLEVLAALRADPRLAQCFRYFRQQAPGVGQIRRANALARVHHRLHGGDARLAPFAVIHAV